jgi:Mn2+/Fe2+ NRAMP family transporter
MKIKARVRSIALFEQLGPGLVTGAADDDPSGIATYSQAGAQFGFDLLWPLDPIKALFYSAVINGFVAVPIMAAMMLGVSRGSAMGKFTARPRVLFFGWTATIAMAAAAAAMIVAQ